MVPDTALKASISSIRTHLEDLQAEIEAGGRCVGRIDSEAKALDSHVAIQFPTAARCGALRQCCAELSASIAQQRTIMRALRMRIDRIRRELASRRSPRRQAGKASGLAG